MMDTAITAQPERKIKTYCLHFDQKEITIISPEQFEIIKKALKGGAKFISVNDILISVYHIRYIEPRYNF